MEIESIVLMSIVWALMSIMIVVRYYVNKTRVTIDTYISTKRMNNISIKKAIKLWIVLQILSIFFINDPMDRWCVTFGLPITIIYVLFTVYYFDTFPRNQEEYDKEVDENEFRNYRKSEVRDKKIKDILK